MTSDDVPIEIGEEYNDHDKARVLEARRITDHNVWFRDVDDDSTVGFPRHRFPGIVDDGTIEKVGEPVEEAADG